MKKTYLILLILALSSCAKAKIEYEYPQDPEIARKARAGKFFDDITVYGGKKEENLSKKEANSSALFLSAKKVLGAVIEIDVEDQNLGIISTKWQENTKRRERTKITALIKSGKLDENNIEIVIHKKLLDADNNWQNLDSNSSNNDQLIKLLKEKIIKNAK